MYWRKKKEYFKSSRFLLYAAYVLRLFTKQNYVVKKNVILWKKGEKAWSFSFRWRLWLRQPLRFGLPVNNTSHQIRQILAAQQWVFNSPSPSDLEVCSSVEWYLECSKSHLCLKKKIVKKNLHALISQRTAFSHELAARLSCPSIKQATG